MRTVRSAARRRNQPRPGLALIAFAVAVLLAVLAARAHARPAGDELAAEPGELAELEAWSEASRRRERVLVPVSPATLERIVMVAPSVASVVAATYRAAGLAGDPTPGWRRRSRLSALLPNVSMRTGQNQAWREVLDPTVSRSLGFGVRASWDLGNLLFDGNEMRIAAADTARRREKRRLAALAIRTYYDWLAARAAGGADVGALLVAAEKAAELDALTDGWFSQALAKTAEPR